MKRLLIAAMCLWLCACALIGGPSPTPFDGDPASLEEFEIKGRVGLHGGGSASLNWHQLGKQYRILLSGPFGTGRIRIDGDGDVVSWEDGNGRYTTTESPETLLSNHLGWQIPVTALRFWVRGLPNPDSPIGQFRMDDGLLRVLEQDGWLLQLDRYQDISGATLPGRLVLQQADTRIILLISEWILR